MTRTGTPARAKVWIVFSRMAGGLVRGSSTRTKSASSDVTETLTAQSFCSACGASKSRSRIIKAFLVMMSKAWRASTITSMQARVIFRRRSAG